MSEFRDSSYHENIGRRVMTPEEEASYPWEQHSGGDIDIFRAFLKLCIVEDPIWEKISYELKEPISSAHVDECVLSSATYDGRKHGEKESKALELIESGKASNYESKEQ
ncbi:hypothetical protein Tco_1334950 [Tanacetum coccineum]